MVVTFTAYWPFGYMKYKSYAGTDKDGATNFCGILPSSMMPAAPTTSSTEFLVYNCGTEKCDTQIIIGGTAANGLTLTNQTNGTKCVLTSLPASGNLTIDSFVGTVRTSVGINYAYHDKGFIRLDPCAAIDVSASWSASSNIINLHGKTTSASWAGRYIYVGGAWKKITAVPSDSTLQVESTMSSAGSAMTKIAVMNRITLTGTNVTLTTFTLDYTPLMTI